MRVLEIGTGTGYNAALLACRLGARNITTIEIDPALTAHACHALTTAGYGEVSVVTGDGTHRHPAGVPFDRVISTANVTRVPYAWMAQTRPGGQVLTPWGTPYYQESETCWGRQATRVVDLRVSAGGLGRGRSSSADQHCHSGPRPQVLMPSSTLPPPTCFALGGWVVADFLPAASRNGGVSWRTRAVNRTAVGSAVA
jgi:hypothetical protein